MPKHSNKDSDDGTVEPKPVVVEPNGKALTNKRARQRENREAAQKLWAQILVNIQKATKP